jgi:hypothetical protein
VTECYQTQVGVVIPIKLELSASVGFIHKESNMMNGHAVLKKRRTSKSSVVVAYFFPGRAKNLSAPLYVYIYIYIHIQKENKKIHMLNFEGISTYN